jgi:hypothetical protein
MGTQSSALLFEIVCRIYRLGLSALWHRDRYVFSSARISSILNDMQNSACLAASSDFVHFCLASLDNGLAWRIIDPLKTRSMDLR